VRLSLLVLRPLLAYCTSPWWWWNEDWQGKPKYSEKTCPSATLSTTNPTWLDPGLKPATNRLSYGAALLYTKLGQILWRNIWGKIQRNKEKLKEEKKKKKMKQASVTHSFVSEKFSFSSKVIKLLLLQLKWVLYSHTHRCLHHMPCIFPRLFKGMECISNSRKSI
jgi:hypothetical protein